MQIVPLAQKISQQKQKQTLLPFLSPDVHMHTHTCKAVSTVSHSTHTNFQIDAGEMKLQRRPLEEQNGSCGGGGAAAGSSQ